MPVGRPLSIDEEKDRQLKAICRLDPTLEDCAAYLGVHASTVTRHIKDAYGQNFAEFRQENMVHTRLSLKRTAIRKAENGDTAALIFCLKNLCGWKDKHEVDQVSSVINITVDKEDLDL